MIKVLHNSQRDEILITIERPSERIKTLSSNGDKMEGYTQISLNKSVSHQAEMKNISQAPQGSGLVKMVK